jgi:ABC-type glycerol-3-phosphate transport system permease component
VGVRKRSFSDIVIWVVLFLCMAVCLIPFLNTVAISFSDRSSADAGRVLIWPVNFTLAPYEELIKDEQLFRSFFISLYRVLLGGVINVVLVILTAFPLSKNPAQVRAKNRYMWFIVFLMLFNGGMIPNYVLVSGLGLINSIWSLVLPGAVQIFSVIVLMNYYKTIPPSLEEAARMDGASPWYVLLRVFVPLSAPSIAVVALWSVVGHWNSFFDGMVYINLKQNQPLQTYIQQLTTNIDWSLASSMSGEDIARMLRVSDLTFTSAKVVFSLVPILLIYPFLQRYFVQGIVMGAVKE